MKKSPSYPLLKTRRRPKCSQRLASAEISYRAQQLFLLWYVLVHLLSHPTHVAIQTEHTSDELVMVEKSKPAPKLKSAMKNKTTKSQETEAQIEQSITDIYDLSLNNDVEQNSGRRDGKDSTPKRGLLSSSVPPISTHTPVTVNSRHVEAGGVRRTKKDTKQSSTPPTHGKAAAIHLKGSSRQTDQSPPPKTEGVLGTAARNATRKKLDRVRQKQAESPVKGPKRGSRTRDVFKDNASVTSDEDADDNEESEQNSPMGDIQRILDQITKIITGNISDKVAFVQSDAHIAGAQIVAHAKADLSVLHTQKRAQLDEVLAVSGQYLKHLDDLSLAHSELHNKNSSLMVALKDTIKNHDSRSLAGRLPATLFSS
ncbi:hypothetical protein CALVIDRAFT_394772 [Calocera viscosa TUFC12733]|uniref:Uncharacterized protein n=1 Tax=Calocera viscosa (strain TUFC12733) TaxID=1330018 RepID=A0A167GBQ6_CALVF|nr:hypothetical protein CALVIDRAFT_394772 [Calocera viscosa TUFC12733]